MKKAAADTGNEGNTPADRPETHVPCSNDAPLEFSAGDNSKNTNRASDKTISGATGQSSRRTKKHGNPTDEQGNNTSVIERHISWQLFWSFLKIGMFTFGGGYAMIPLIKREVTDHRQWVPNDRFLELLTLAQSAPGPISLNTAVFVGYTLNRYKGAAAAILGVIVPSFVILLFIAMYFSGIKDNDAVVAVFKGMRPAVVALIVAPVLGFTKGMGPYRIGIAVVVAAAIWRLGASPALLIILGAAGGILWALYRKRKEARQ